MSQPSDLKAPILTGRDWNFFQKVIVYPVGSFNTDCDIVIPFVTQGFHLVNLGSGSTNIIEVSFNGNTVHAELNPNTNSPTNSLLFSDRLASKIWFRVQSGSTSCTVSVQAWARR